MELSDIRREYSKGGLRRDDLPSDPLVLFERWLKQAVEAQLPDPTAMTVATVDGSGQPFQRIVLLKHFDEHGRPGNYNINKVFCGVGTSITSGMGMSGSMPVFSSCQATIHIMPR